MLISPPFLITPQGASDANESDEAYVARNMAGGTPGNGAFPVSFNFQWHAGLHVNGPTIPVRAIADGKVKYVRPAATICKEDDPLDYHAGWTSDGVVVIEHTTEIGENVEITYYSVYQHLSLVNNSISKGKPVYRKDDLGRAGYIYGEPNKFHFEICCDDANLEKMMGRKSGKLDISKDGRTNALWGDMHFALPVGTAIHAIDMLAAEQAVPATAKAAQQAQQKSLQAAQKFAAAQQAASAAATASAAAPGNAALKAKKKQTATAADKAKIEADKAQQAATDAQAKATEANNTYTQALQSPSHTTTQPLFVGMRYWRGQCTKTTYMESGKVVGSEVKEDKDYEYHLYEYASKLYPACPSAGYELLRFGRVVGPDALSPANPTHWRKISYPDGEGWVNLRPDAIKKFSDADFPHWCGWTLVDDDTNGDSRCDSTTVKKLVLDDDDKCYDESTANDRLKLASVQAKLKRTLCKLRSEWDPADLDNRWGWLKPDAPDGQGPLQRMLTTLKTEEDFAKLKAHLTALSFWDKAGMGNTPYWYFDPREFISVFRKCGWLNKTELLQLVPSHALRQHNNNYLWEAVPQNANGVVATTLLPSLNRTLRKYGINTPMRQAGFFGNAVQETGWLRLIAEGAASGYWYWPWFGRGLLQLTHPDNYIGYWRWRGRAVPATLEEALKKAKKKAHDEHNNAHLHDANFPELTQEMISWRDAVSSSADPQANPENKIAPPDTAGYYWAKLNMAYYADEPGTQSLQRVSVQTNQGSKVYYRSRGFWKVSAAVNAPAYINSTTYAGLNGFDARCCAYGVAIAILTERCLPDAQGQELLFYPEGYTRRTP